MRTPAICMLLALVLIGTRSAAQGELENVIVETYYVSDANDATDLTGGGLSEGSVTYRVFLDLCQDCRLRAIYGDANHVLSITSTAPFFNHADRGRTFGHLVNNTALSEGTAPLDSYLSLGRASTQRLGVTKTLDDNGSEVGGTNNDGGSESIAGGLLVNNVPAMGLPITEADGLMPLNGAPGTPSGFLATGDDPATIFGDITASDTFVSHECRIGAISPGVSGATAENVVLIAQLTTAGDLAFLLNVEVERADGTVLKFVSTGDTLLPGELLNGLLVYPPDCGCTDPDFLEYDPLAGCDDGSCATAIVFGCLDPAACNFSSTANFNVPQLCCYGINDCNGLDPYLVCPTIGIEERSAAELLVAPNPTHGPVRITGADRLGPSLMIEIMDAAGRSLRREAAQALLDGSLHADLSALADGAYLIVLHGGTGRAAARVLKH
jgi:hypothetical protein